MLFKMQDYSQGWYGFPARVSGDVALSGLLAYGEKHLACLHVFGKTTRQVESSIMMRFARGSETRHLSRIFYTEKDD